MSPESPPDLGMDAMNVTPKLPFWKPILKGKSPLKRKPCWLAPEESVGAKYDGISFGNRSCWEANGLVREKFISLASEIKEYLEKHSDPVSRPVTWTVYMIGVTPQSSKPTLMFCSEDKTSRSIILNRVRESGVLENYPGFSTGACSREFRRFATGIETPAVGQHEALLFYDRCNVGPGMFIYLKRTEEDELPYRKARCGGVLCCNGIYFLQTVVHIFEESSHGTYPSRMSKIEESSDFELDSESDIDIEEDTIEISSRDSATPEDGSETRSILDDSDASTIAASYFQGPPKTKKKSLTDISTRVRVETCRYSTTEVEIESSNSLSRLGGVRLQNSYSDQSGFDYCLIEIPHAEKPYFQDLIYDSQRRLKSISTIPQDTEVYLLRYGNNLIGKLSVTPTFMILPGCKLSQEVWVVRHTGCLQQGDCGSWVVDTTKRTLYGHMVAGSPNMGIAYIIPAHLVFSNLNTGFQDLWSLADGREGDEWLIREWLITPEFQKDSGSDTGAEGNRNKQLTNMENRVHKDDCYNLSDTIITDYSNDFSNPPENSTKSSYGEIDSIELSPQLTAKSSDTFLVDHELVYPWLGRQLPYESSNTSIKTSRHALWRLAPITASQISCDFPGCTKTASRVTDLTRHKFEVHSARRRCALCSFSTKREGRLRQHMARWHMSRFCMSEGLLVVPDGFSNTEGNLFCSPEVQGSSTDHEEDPKFV